MIDWKRVEELREEIGPEGFLEVACMFLEEAEQAVTALLEGLPVDKIGRQLHFLKGSALNLGLSDLAVVCQDGERKAAEGHGATVDPSHVAAVYHASRDLLLSLLNQVTAA